MQNQVFIKDGATLTPVERYSDDGQTLAYLNAGGILTTVEYLGKTSEDGRDTYVMSYGSFKRGDIVQLSLTREEYMEKMEAQEDMVGTCAALFYGDVIADTKYDVFKRCFKIGENFEIEVSIDGEPTKMTIQLLKDERVTFNITEQLIAHASKEDMDRQELTSRISRAAENRRAATAAETSDMLQRRLGLMRQVAVLDRALYEASKISALEYVKREINSSLLSISKIAKDARVFFVEKVSEESIVIITNPVWIKIQGVPEEPSIPMGILEITLRPEAPALSYPTSAATGISHHPHGSNGICIGSYSSAYSQAMARKDYLTAWEIAIEVATNANLDSLANRAGDWLPDIVGREFYFDKYEQESIEDSDMDWEAIRDVLTTEDRMSAIESACENYLALLPKKTIEQPSFPEALIEEIFHNLYDKNGNQK